MMRQLRPCAVAAALALAGSFAVVVPTAAADAPGIAPGVEDQGDSPSPHSATGDKADSSRDSEEFQHTDDAGLQPHNETDIGIGTDGEEESERDTAVEELRSTGPIGPVGFTGVPTYEALWAPGEAVPTGIDIVNHGVNVDMVTLEAEDRSSFAALLVIGSQETPREFRFENAVPLGLTALLNSDGSVKFINSDGTESGGLAAPWAVDADGNVVPTRYSLDGTTVIQSVQHDGAVYPVIADPLWFATYYAALQLALRIAAPKAAEVLSACSISHCVPIVTTVVSAVHRGISRLGSGSGGSGSGGRPRNSAKCSARNPSGC